MTASVMREFRKNVQMISQDTSSSFDPTRTLRDSVRRPAQELLGVDKSKADALVGRDPRDGWHRAADGGPQAHRRLRRTASAHRHRAVVGRQAGSHPV